MFNSLSAFYFAPVLQHTKAINGFNCPVALFREHEGVNTFLRKKNRATETLRLKVPTNLEFWIPFLAVFGIMQAF